MPLSLGSMTNINTSTAIGSTYDVSKAVRLQYSKFGTSKILIHASMLEVQMSNISGPTKITVKLSRDASADNYVLTSTESIIEYGETTNSKGSALIRLDVILSDVEDQILYLHVKSDSGTLDISSAALNFEQ
jgi:hypothetical protein